MGTLFGTLMVDAEKYPNVCDARESLCDELTDILESEIYRHNHRDAYETANSMVRDSGRVFDETFLDRRAAESFLNGKMVCGSLVACKYMKPVGMDKRYRDKAELLRYEMGKYEEKHAIRNYASTKRKHCPHCGSDVNVEYFRTDECPVCGTDLRSATVARTLARYAERIKEAEKKYAGSAKGRRPYWMFVFEAYGG